MNPLEHPRFVKAWEQISVARPRETFAALGRNADDFLRRLQREGVEAQRLIAALERIDPAAHRTRIDYLRGNLRHIQETATQSLAIFTEACEAFHHQSRTADTLEDFDSFLNKLDEEKVKPLTESVYGRQRRNEVYQGHFVGSDRVTFPSGAGYINSIRLEFLRRLNSAILTEGSFRKVWMHMDGDAVIWLYHHEEVAKWQCIYVRIEFRPIGRALIAEAEYFVPFGIEGDLSHYKTETSECYWRTGWKIKDVVQAGFSTSVTRSFTDSHAHGESVSVTRGSGNSESQANGTQSGGSLSSGAGGWTQGSNWSRNSTATDSASSHRDQTVGTSETDTTSESNSDSEGRSLTVVRKAFGIDMGQANEELLNKWKAGNRPAARIFDDVQTFIQTELSELAGAGWDKRGAKEVVTSEAIAEYEKLIPIEAVPDSLIGRRILESSGLLEIPGRSGA